MDVIQAIKERRSINFFEPGRKIPDNKLKDLIEVANLAPSSFNLQPWKVVVVKDPEKKKILKQCAFNQPKVEEASVVLIMVADPGAMEENIDRMLDSWQELGYIKPEMRETYKGMANNLYGPADSLKRKIFAVKNSSLFAMNLMIAAKGLGLETHPMDGFDEECVKKEFNIPADKIIPMLIAVGYLRSGITLLPRAFRRRIDEFVKFEKY
ncbi:MAG: nitroreductase family protein [Nitrospirae bacterium]|nr:nitroreductase family protein [Nitrospirota bacterium]MCL5061657.1 nitroreductase family protein [Nitrospirota bacterium]MDA8337686.1 nitroreductase family protein [Nitrospiraceae bacterium]